MRERERQAQKPEVRELFFFLKWAAGFLPYFPSFPIHLLRVNWHLKWPLSSPSSGEEPDSAGDRAWSGMGTARDLLQWHCFAAQLIPVMGKLPHKSSFMPGVRKDGMRRAENYRWQWLSWVSMEGWVGKTVPVSPGLCLGTGIQELTRPPAPKAFYTRIIRLRRWKASVLKAVGEGGYSRPLPSGGVGDDAQWPEPMSLWRILPTVAHPPLLTVSCLSQMLGLLARAPLCHIPGISSLTAVLASSFDFQFSHYPKLGFCLFLVTLS